MSTTYQNISLSGNSSNTINFNITGDTLYKDNKFQVNDGEIALKTHIPTFYVQHNPSSSDIPELIRLQDGPVQYSAFRIQYCYGTNTIYDTIFCFDSDNAYKTFNTLYPNVNIVRIAEQTVSGVESGGFIPINFLMPEDINFIFNKDLGNENISLKISSLFT